MTQRKVPFGKENLLAVLRKGSMWCWILEAGAMAVSALMLTGNLHLKVLSFDLAPIIGAVVGLAAIFLIADQVYRVQLVKSGRICLRKMICRGKSESRGKEKPGTYLQFDGVRIRAVGRMMLEAEPGDAFYFVFFRPDARGKYDMIVSDKAVELSEELKKRVR